MTLLRVARVTVDRAPDRITVNMAPPTERQQQGQAHTRVSTTTINRTTTDGSLDIEVEPGLLAVGLSFGGNHQPQVLVDVPDQTEAWLDDLTPLVPEPVPVGLVTQAQYAVVVDALADAVARITALEQGEVTPPQPTPGTYTDVYADTY